MKFDWNNIYGNSYHKLSHCAKLHFQIGHHILQKYDLYPGQPALLFYLYNKEGENQKHIAEILSIKPATVNIMINRLEKSDFIIRKKNPSDLRNTKIFLTDKGRSVCDKLYEVILETEKAYFVHFSKEEMDTFNTLLSKLINSLKEIKTEENL